MPAIVNNNKVSFASKGLHLCGVNDNLISAEDETVPEGLLTFF